MGHIYLDDDGLPKGDAVNTFVYAQQGYIFGEYDDEKEEEISAEDDDDENEEGLSDEDNEKKEALTAEDAWTVISAHFRENGLVR